MKSSPSSFQTFLSRVGLRRTSQTKRNTNQSPPVETSNGDLHPHDDIYEGVIIPDTKQFPVTDLSRIAREAFLTADRNKWFLIALLLSLLLAFTIYKYMALSSFQASNYKVAYIKMYGNGTWDTDFQDEYRETEFLQAMIDSVLTLWVVRRYSEDPLNVQTDYGYANQFMSQALSSAFVEREGFNAPQKAVDVIDCVDCPIVKYKVRTIDHVDWHENTMGRVRGTIYLSYVFVTRETISPDGILESSAEEIVSVQWRLMTTEERYSSVNGPGGLEWLRMNPMGMEILSYEKKREQN